MSIIHIMPTFPLCQIPSGCYSPWPAIPKIKFLLKSKIFVSYSFHPSSTSNYETPIRQTFQFIFINFLFASTTLTKLVPFTNIKLSNTLLQWILIQATLGFLFLSSISGPLISYPRVTQLSLPCSSLHNRFGWRNPELMECHRCEILSSLASCNCQYFHYSFFSLFHILLWSVYFKLKRI